MRAVLVQEPERSFIILRMSYKVRGPDPAVCNTLVTATVSTLQQMRVPYRVSTPSPSALLDQQ